MCIVSEIQTTFSVAKMMSGGRGRREEDDEADLHFLVTKSTKIWLFGENYYQKYELIFFGEKQLPQVRVNFLLVKATTKSTS